MSAFHDLKLKSLAGEPLSFDVFADKVVLVVNVASECGLTPQYEGLQALHSAFAERGFSVIGVPCNQFGSQEPGDAAQIREFCSRHYGVTFALTEKLEVNGPGRHPLYRLLAGEGAEFPGDISWNFEKFLVARDGAVLARFAPRTTPDDPALQQAIEQALDK